MRHATCLARPHRHRLCWLVPTRTDPGATPVAPVEVEVYDDEGEFVRTMGRLRTGQGGWMR